VPQLTQAKKALRSDSRRRKINDRWRRQLRNALKEVRVSLTGTDIKAAQTAVDKAESTLDRAARHHIIHPNKASRKKSRLRKAVARLQTS